MENIFITGLDTETTGLNVDDGDRVIELCCQVYRLQDRKRLIDTTNRFSNEGRKINAKAQKVHGISAADLVGSPMFKTFAPKLASIFKKSKIVVAHNAMFDMRFLVHHMHEAGYPIPKDLIIFDTMAEGMSCSYDSKPPSLREFCWAHGVDYNPDKAHAADYDVIVMMEAFFKALDYGTFQLPDMGEIAAPLAA